MENYKSANRLTTYTEGQVLVMERSLKAPRELVFKAFSEKEHLANWWGPQGWQTKTLKFEFKPNGEWHYCMKCIDEKQGHFFDQESFGKAIYQEIVVPEKIVYTDLFVDAEGNPIDGMPEILVTMTFTEKEGETNLIVQSKFASIESLQQVMNMGIVQGFASQFDRLDHLLEVLNN